MTKRIALILLFAVWGVLTVRAQDSSVRVRFAHLSPDVEPLDIWVNGAVAFSAQFGTITRYFEGGAGTYQLAAVPSGQDISAAVLGPADVSFEAGRSYTLAAVGQRADLSLSPLVIDENLLLETYNIDPASSWVLLLHAVSGAPAVDVYFNDTLVVSGLGFGASLVAEATEASFQLRVTAAGQSGDILNQTLLGLPNNTQFVTVAGTADDFSVIVGSNSPLNAVDFLRGLSGQPTSFDTLLAAVDAAGLTDALANQGPFTLFAPPDSAFAALPAGTLEAALADPTLLTNILGYHVVPDYVTSADVVDELLTTGSVTLSTAQGGALTISSSDGRVLINGTAQILATDYYVRNGVIHVIDSLLVP